LEKPLLHVQHFKKVFEMEAEIEMGGSLRKFMMKGQDKDIV